MATAAARRYHPVNSRRTLLPDLLIDWIGYVCLCVCSLEALPQLDPSRAVVMFPSDDAVLPDQLAVDQMDHVIIIDSKW